MTVEDLDLKLHQGWGRGREGEGVRRDGYRGKSNVACIAVMIRKCTFFGGGGLQFDVEGVQEQIELQGLLRYC